MALITTQGKIDQDSPKLVRLVDEYSIVIQEFFQERVKVWLDTVGKEIFRIKHYWGRFEFAPARGQIHLHLLAIADDPTFNQTMHKLKGDSSAQAKFLQEWSAGALGYTAEVDKEIYNDLDLSHQDNPCRERFTEAPDKALDSQRLLKFCQEHNCSGYCMRCEKKKSKSKKSEKEKGKGNNSDSCKDDSSSKRQAAAAAAGKRCVHRIPDSVFLVFDTISPKSFMTFETKVNFEA